MLKHKFAVGQVVWVEDNYNSNVRPGMYKILRTLPVTNSVCQYRAKNVLDNYERVLDETQLRAAS